jgi:acyl phosphate:glycerol-3-phosphate acyltransferase
LNFHLALLPGEAPSFANLWWLPVVAYLVGAIPFGYWIVRLRGRGDIRGQGSGNIGATNVARRAGMAAGVLTLLLDGAKGYFAVWLAERASAGNIRWMMLAGVLAIVGHIFPFWLGFHGGRGVATGLGVFLLISWKAVVVAVVVWILVVGFWRYISLGSISAAASLPLLVYLLYAPPLAPPLAVTAGTLLAVALVILQHRNNITRLLQGAEPQIIFRRDERREKQ